MGRKDIQRHPSAQADRKSTQDQQIYWGETNNANQQRRNLECIARNGRSGDQSTGAKVQQNINCQGNERQETGTHQDIRAGAESRERGAEAKDIQDWLAPGDIEFAEAATVLIDQDSYEQICGRMVNYDVVTETRDLEIEWENALLLTKNSKILENSCHIPLSKSNARMADRNLERKYT